MYPRIEINLGKLQKNTETLVRRCQSQGIKTIFGVTKVLAGDERAIEAIIAGGVTHLADSRLENLQKMQKYSIPKVLLRLPMQSEVMKVVQYADLSLNSELTTIKKLDEAAKTLGKIHQIILMFDLGDLREGIWYQDDDLSVIQEILNLNHIKLVGIGTNLTCFGGVIPTTENLGTLLEIKSMIEAKFAIHLDIISGGNSSSLYLVYNESLPKGINNLRLGESIVLGRETAYSADLSDLSQDVFKVQAEIIELKQKPSHPIGEIGVDAFGNKPEFIDEGILYRAIVALGKQDIAPERLEPLDSNIRILGGSSDHLILDVSKSKYQLGDIIAFKVDYGGLLQAMTSPYVHKIYI